jgi:hypothetical protein
MKFRDYIPNAIVFLSDPGNKHLNPPEWNDDKPYEANENCVSVGTLHGLEGLTDIQIINADKSKIIPEMKNIYSGEIQTPTRKLSLDTSEKLDVLSCQVSGTSCFVRVWTNRIAEPDCIIFALDDK